MVNKPTFSLIISHHGRWKKGASIDSPPLLLLLPLLSLLPLPLRHHPCLPLQPCCKDCCCHGRCLHRYQCRLPHIVDCCLPLQFLLLSTTTLATVTAAATADPVLAAVTVAVRRCHCHHQRQCFHQRPTVTTVLQTSSPRLPPKPPLPPTLPPLHCHCHTAALLPRCRRHRCCAACKAAATNDCATALPPRCCRR